MSIPIRAGSPLYRQSAFWERAAAAALLVLLEDAELTQTEAVEAAVACADKLLHAWRERFHFDPPGAA